MWVYWQTLEITITSPSSTDNWKDRNTYTMTWTSRGPIDRVTIELYKASTLIEEITFLYTDNDGSYDFYISTLDDFDAGTNYRIKITDYDDPDVYDFSSYFSINYQEPLNYRAIFTGLFIFIGVSAVLGLIIYGIRRQSHRQKTLKSTPRRIQQQLPQPTVQQIKRNIKENLKFCVNCGQPNKNHSKFCEECGTEMVF